jgi:large-conductance mechanosensitive channel
MSIKEESEETTITGSMGDAEIQNAVLRAVKAIPGAIGVNNHQGSRATADRRVMKLILGVLKNNDLFFVDSRTSSKSVAVDSARQLGVLTTENHLFLDNSSDVGVIKNQLRQAVEIALKQGSATFICHARPHSAQAVKEMIPELKSVSDEMAYKKTALMHSQEIYNDTQKTVVGTADPRRKTKFVIITVLALIIALAVFLALHLTNKASNKKTTEIPTVPKSEVQPPKEVVEKDISTRGVLNIHNPIVLSSGSNNTNGNFLTITHDRITNITTVYYMCWSYSFVYIVY